MNQILSTEDINNKYNKKRGSTKSIESIAKFFAIMLIIFGIFLVATSSFAIFKGTGSTNNGQAQASEKAEIQVEQKGENKLLVTVMSQTEIKDIEYYWDEEDIKTEQGQGRKYVQIKNIEIPQGENDFTLKVTDINGEVTDYVQTYTLESDIDIQMKQSGNNVKINVTGKNEIKTVVYTWDEEETKDIEVNASEYSFEVEVSLGEHKLVVKATDINGTVEEKTITIMGATKPTVNISAGDNCYIITAHDDVGLKRVEIETVSDGKVTKMQADGKDFEYSFPLKEGDENYIKVTAINTKDVKSKELKAVWKK